VNKRDGELYSEFYEKECSKVASETSVIPPITSGCEGGNRRSPLIGESNVKDLHKLEGPSGEFSENSPNVSVLTSSNLGVCDGEGIASKISESVSCRFKIRHFLVEGDILQDPGQVRLGVDVKNEKGVKAYIFNHGFEDEEETRWTHEIYYDAHCLPLSTYDKGREGRFKTTLNRVLKGKEAWKNLVTGLGQLTK
jgi:hypothetical protein